MILTTKRLTLRPFQETDAPSLFACAKDPDVGPAAGWPAHRSVAESLDALRYALMGAQCYAICEKGTDTVIGAVELMLNGHTNCTKQDDECELGYWLGKAYWGRGYMPEAAQTLIRYGFEQLHMQTIWCGYYAGNAKSKRVQEKLGFVYHHTELDKPVPLLGEHRTEYVNCMSRTQWACWEQAHSL